MAHFLGGLAVTCLPLNPRFKGSNLPKVDGFLRAPGVPHWHLKEPFTHDKRKVKAKLDTIFGLSATGCHRSHMTRTSDRQEWEQLEIT
jgi:hypothetical protein